MAVDDHGLEVLKKSGEQAVPGNKSDYYIKVGLFGNFQAPLGAKLISATDSFDGSYFLTVLRYYDGGTPAAPGTLISSLTLYYLDDDRCEFAWLKVGAP